MLSKLMLDLTGKTALVTGAGRKNGIGAAIAYGLGQAGADVIIHDVNPIEPEILQTFDAAKISVHSFVSDLSLKGSSEQLISALTEQFGVLDIVVLNASYQVLKPLSEQNMTEIEHQIQLNFVSQVTMLQSVLPLMQQQGWGRVVNIGSINQAAPKPIVPIYAATKAATHNLIQSLAKEYASSDVLLNTIAPGLIDTYPEERAGALLATKQWDDYAKQLNAFGHAGKPEDIVGAAVYLASPACSFMTGETMFITGGQVR